MTHIRMILKHLCLSGMHGIIGSKIIDFDNNFVTLYPCYVLCR